MTIKKKIEGGNFIQLVKDMVQWRDVVSTTAVPQEEGSFLTTIYEPLLKDDSVLHSFVRSFIHPFMHSSFHYIDHLTKIP
jgi:hypothetical protein